MFENQVCGNPPRPNYQLACLTPLRLTSYTKNVLRLS